MADLVNRQHGSIVSINDMSMETDTIICKPYSECHRTDVSNNSSDPDPCDGKNDLERENVNSCSEDIKNFIDPVEELHERSSNFVSAGQIRARCSSAKNMPNSSQGKSLKRLSKADSDELNSDKESSKNFSAKKHSKPTNIFKKSPGLALRLSENPIYNHDVTNGNYDDDDEKEDNQENIPESEEGCKNFCSEPGGPVLTDGCNDLTNYKLVQKEREEKLEKIARIDLLYQKQIESEMNAGMEAHLDENLRAETKVQTTPSSHDEAFDVPPVDHVVKIRKPNLLIDPSLAPKRKNPKTCRPVFSRFPGKSVNLPSVEDGLSSGNASGDDNDAGADASGNEEPNCGFLNPLPVESPATDDSEVDRQKSENLADENFDSKDVEKQGMENSLENLNLKPADAEIITDDQLNDCKTSLDDRSTRSNLSTEQCRRDDVQNSIRPHDEGIDCREEDLEEMKNIQSIGASDNTAIDCARQEDSTLENDINKDEGTASEVGETAVDIDVAVTETVVSGQGSPSSLSNRDCDDISRDLFASAVNSSSEVTAFPPTFSSDVDSSVTTYSATTPSHGTETSSKIAADVPILNQQGDAFEFKSGLSSDGRRCDETEVARKMQTDFAQKYPKVPLPHIRTGSTCSPPISLDVAQKSLPPQKVECEVFELQPILGISSKVPQVHRSPSPFSGKFPASIAEKTSESGWPAPSEDPSPDRPVGSGKDSNSSDDVENAIRDIKSAIMRSKNIKLSLPQQMEEVGTDNRAEPVWITRQPLYGRGAATPSTTVIKNFQGRQELVNNAKSALPSEEEGEKFSGQEDNYYITKGVPGFPVHGNYQHQCLGADILPSCNNPLNDKPWASIGEIDQGSPRVQNHFGRRLELARHPPSSSGYGSMTFQPEAVEHVPYSCNRYDCYECRHLPDSFDDEEDADDCENEDDEETGGENNYCEEEEDEEEEDCDDETTEVVNNYVQMKPELDIASPCRIHGGHHRPLVTGGNVHRGSMEISRPTGSRHGKTDDDESVERKHLPWNHPKSPSKHDRSSEAKYPEYSTDEETDNLLKKQYNQGTPEEGSRRRETPPSKQTQFEQRRNKAREVALRDPSNESVLIEGVLFRANYLGSTQLISEGQPSKAMRMMQAQEAVSRIKAPDGESQPSTEVDLFVSVEKIMVLNTNLQEIMMDHALRTISYIADIGDILVIMARRGSVVKNSDSAGPRRTQTKICCHVFESEEAQLVAQSIGQAFQVSYVEFLKANGIEETSNVKNMDYQDVLNQQEVYGEELYMLSNKEMQREVVVSKVKGEALGVVVVESGWGSMIPTVVLANMAPCGAAARCNQLNIGDQIISINSISMVGLPLTTCQSYIKAAKSQSVVKLTVVSCPPVVEVLIKRPDVKYQLGFSVQNGVICSLLRGGIAERGGVRVGHRIIEINGQSVVATHHEKIVNMLATSAGEIHMKTMPTSIFQLLTGQIVPHYI